jgi:hypothetical protein
LKALFLFGIRVRVAALGSSPRRSSPSTVADSTYLCTTHGAVAAHDRSACAFMNRSARATSAASPASKNTMSSPPLDSEALSAHAPPRRRTARGTVFAESRSVLAHSPTHPPSSSLLLVAVCFGAFADASTVLLLLVVALLRVDDERLGQGRVRGCVFFADGILVPPQRRREIGFSRQRRDQQEPVRRGGSIQHAVPADISALRPLQTSIARVIHVPVPPFEPETCESERGRRGGVSKAVSCEYVFLGSNATSLAVKKRRGAHPSNASSRIRRS